jgi:hypothetical protein
MPSGGLRFDKVERNRLLFLAHVTARTGVPEIEVERIVELVAPVEVKVGSKAAPKKPDEIKLEELNTNGSLATGVEKVQLQLTGTPFDVPTLQTWHIAITTPPGGGASTLVFRARTDPSAAFEEIDRLDISVPKAKHNQARTPIIKTAPVFPRLVVGLNRAQPEVLPGDEEGDGIASDPAALRPYLLRLLRVLSERGTLDPAWSEQGETPVEFEAKTALIQQAEQAWARQVAEMASLCGYGGAAGTYGVKDEATVTVGHIQQGTLANDNPYYPITFACQQLGSFIIASRGLQAFPKGFLGPRVLNAGADTAPLFPKDLSGRWIVLPLSNQPPQELKDGGNGNPHLMNNSTLLKKSEKLFEIDEVFPDTPFAAGATFLYSNREARRNIAFHSDGVGCEVTQTLAGLEEICLEKPTLAERQSGVGSKIKSINPVLRPTAGNPELLKNNTGGAHIGTALRVMRIPPGRDPLRSRQLSRFQVLDTGGLRVASWTAGVQALDSTQAKMHAGIFEGPATDEVGDGDPLRGVGVLPKVQPSDAPIMAKHTREVLQKARPLGFVRLLLAKRDTPITFDGAAKALTDGTVIFLSALAPMYASEQALKEAGLDKATELAPFANFHMTRLLWSLRNAPDLQNVQPTWLIYLPRGSLLDAMRGDFDRSKTALDMARDIFRSVEALPNGRALLRESALLDKRGQPDPNRLLAIKTYPVMSITARADGVVQRKGAHAINNLEGRDVNRPITADMGKAFPATATGFPRYFAGEF